MAKNIDYTDFINKSYRQIEKSFKSPKLWAKQDETIIELYSLLKDAVWRQIHTVLAPQKTEAAEKQIRDILAKYVLGWADTKKKISFIGA